MQQLDRTREFPEESLELCTEILGSETGCDFSPTTDFFSSTKPTPILSTFSAGIVDEDNTKAKQITRLPKGPTHNFPPPLMWSVQMRRHIEEGGRLIIEAASYKMVDRSEGRVRLCFLPFGDEEEEVEEKEEEAEREESEVERMVRCEERARHGNRWKENIVRKLNRKFESLRCGLQLLKFLVYKFNVWAGI